MVKGHVFVEQFAESSQFFLVGQLAGKQEKGHLFETEALLFEQWRHQLVQLIAPIEQFSFGRFQTAVLGHFIAYDITDVGQTDQHARAVFVAQTALHTISGKQLIVNLTGVLDFVAELIYQVFLVHLSFSFSNQLFSEHCS